MLLPSAESAPRFEHRDGTLAEVPKFRPMERESLTSPPVKGISNPRVGAAYVVERLQLPGAPTATVTVQFSRYARPSQYLATVGSQLMGKGFVASDSAVIWP
jgi:hypothetical protein